MEIQAVTIPSGNETLSGLVYVPDSGVSEKFPSIVIFHGRGSSKKRYMDRAENLSRNGFVTLVFDFRGCGESGGMFGNQTIEMGFEDARAGYTFLRNHPVAIRNGSV